MSIQFVVCNRILLTRQNMVSDLCYIQLLLNRSFDVLCYRDIMKYDTDIAICERDIKVLSYVAE
jgi:hypothetical protein